MQRKRAYLDSMPNKDGYFGKFGGAYLPPELIEPFAKINEAYDKLSKSHDFIHELKKIRKYCSSRFIRTGCRRNSDSFKVEIF